jgi:hypothetical protein
MARQVETVEVIASQRPERSAAVRRRLRLGPRSRSVIRRPLRSRVRSGTADMNIVEKDVDKAVDKGRALAEWHDMTPGQQQVAWAELRAWVAWLYDRYELSTRAGSPLGRPPGTGTPSCGSWCRPLSRCTLPGAGPGTGAPTLVADDPELAEEWARGYPLAGTPGIDIAAGRARLAGNASPPLRSRRPSTLATRRRCRYYGYTSFTPGHGGCRRPRAGSRFPARRGR